MNISEFARERGVKPTTVSLYIRRHKEEFDDHIQPSTTGNSLELDDTALKILDEKYPLQQPIQVLDHDPELERKVNEQNELIKELQAKIILLQQQNGTLDHQLGEAKQKQLMLEAVEQRADAAEAKATKFEDMYNNEKARADEHNNRADVAEAKLEYEQKRSEDAEEEATKYERMYTSEKERATKAETEANSFVKSWFGFWKKKK